MLGVLFATSVIEDHADVSKFNPQQSRNNPAIIYYAISENKL